MAKKFSLALYKISVNIRGKKNEHAVLSDFMNGTDMLDLIFRLLQSLKYDLSTTVDISQNLDEERFFRIMKDNNKDQLFRNGRFISGIIESGDYGTEENIVDILTGESTHTKKINEALLIPFYFLFYIPENSKTGFLVIERIGNIGIYSLLQDRLSKYLMQLISGHGDNNYVFKMNPLVLKTLVTRHLTSAGGGARKITFEQVKKEDLKVSHLTDNEVQDEDVGNTEIVYTAKRNKAFDISKLLKRIQKTNSSNVFSLNGVEYGDVKFEVKINGQPKQMSVKEVEKLGTYMDISDSIELDTNKYPTYRSINKQAHILISYIKDEIINK